MGSVAAILEDLLSRGLMMDKNYEPGLIQGLWGVDAFGLLHVPGQICQKNHLLAWVNFKRRAPTRKEHTGNANFDSVPHGATY